MGYTLETMRHFILAVLFVVFSAVSVHAGIIYWIDDDGVINVTDEIKNVPDRYKDRVKETGPEPLVRIPSPSQRYEPAKKPGRITGTAKDKAKKKKIELYGDHTLEWWRAGFVRFKQHVDNATIEHKEKKRYVEMFERGRRGGAFFEAEDIKDYEKYKKELPGIQARIDKLKVEQAELLRKARYHGVPKHLRIK